MEVSRDSAEIRASVSALELSRSLPTATPKGTDSAFLGFEPE